MLSRKYKLKKDNDFKKVFKDGRYQQKDFIKIKFLKNNLEINRFSFIVGLKISKKAVQRNKIKRRLEEVIRLNFKQIITGFDIIIFTDKEIIEKEYIEIEENLIYLLKKSKLIV